MSVPFTVIDLGTDIGIVVLVPPRPFLDKPLPSLIADSAGAFLGGDCEFLGFPYGSIWSAHSNGRPVWMPFVKHSTVSALVMNNMIWILDGINNEGFSGCPVIFQTSLSQKIMAVISGYYTEPVEVIFAARSVPTPSSKQDEPKATVNVNSGFFVAYDINYAIEAIRKNPIGPSRSAN